MSPAVLKQIESLRETIRRLDRLYYVDAAPGASDVEYDRLIRESLAETDSVRRLDLLTEAEELLMTEMPVMPIYFYSQFHLVRNNIEGWEMNVRNVHLARWMTKTEGE